MYLLVIIIIFPVSSFSACDVLVQVNQSSVCVFTLFLFNILIANSLV